MNRVKFLTELENRCLGLVNEAQSLFDQICEEDPQSASDSFNFGHYIDAARDAILIRGARRMDPANLLPPKRESVDPFNACYGDDE